MSFLHRVLRWLVREIVAAGVDPHEAIPVMLITLTGTTIEGVLVARGTEYSFATGARVMNNGSTRWVEPKGQIRVPASQVDRYVKLIPKTAQRQS